MISLNLDFITACVVFIWSWWIFGAVRVEIVRDLGWLAGWLEIERGGACG